MKASYPPAHYDESDRAVLLQHIRDLPLATFILADGECPYATPLPLVLTAGDSQLLGHLDANNPAAPLVQDGREVLAVFHGPSVYISPDDYTTRQLPTYNYKQVHVRGTLRPLTEPKDVRRDMHLLVEAMEGDGGWQLPPDDARVTAYIPHVVAFRIDIEQIDGRYKLSQDKRSADREAAARKLEAFGRG